MAKNTRCLNLDQRLAIELSRFKSDDADISKKASSLSAWFLRLGYFTQPQRVLIRKIMRAGDDFSKRALRKKIYIYAFSDGQSVKIGVSCNYKNRMKTIQTGHDKKLSCPWVMCVGHDRSWARKAERMLHKRCGEFRISGEWFSVECLPLVFKFSI